LSRTVAQLTRSQKRVRPHLAWVRVGGRGGGRGRGRGRGRVRGGGRGEVRDRVRR
jgi:hypothetical protein